MDFIFCKLKTAQKTWFIIFFCKLKVDASLLRLTKNRHYLLYTGRNVNNSFGYPLWWGTVPFFAWAPRYSAYARGIYCDGGIYQALYRIDDAFDFAISVFADPRVKKRNLMPTICPCYAFVPPTEKSLRKYMKQGYEQCKNLFEERKSILIERL